MSEIGWDFFSFTSFLSLNFSIIFLAFMIVDWWVLLGGGCSRCWSSLGSLFRVLYLFLPAG